jgi:Family of unknown function (DUF6644)
VSVQSVATRLQESALSQDLQAAGWVVPTMQTIHILMIGVVFVSILMVALRVLGWVRVEEPLSRVWRRFAPFLWTGLVIMAVTGLLLILAEPVREVMALSFRIKLLLLLVGIGSACMFGRFVRSAALAGEEAAASASPLIRLASVATVVLWLAIIFLGRAIAYDNSVWGSWSTAVLQKGGST